MLACALSLIGFIVEIVGIVFLYKNDLPDHVLNPLGIRDNKGEMESKRLKDNVKYTLFQKVGFTIMGFGLVLQIPIMAINIFENPSEKNNHCYKVYHIKCDCRCTSK